VSSSDHAYRRLLEIHRERALLESCSDLLDWDAETYLPAGGIELCAERQVLLARLEHERATDPRISDLLAEAGAGEEDDPLRAANLRELRREHDKAVRVPVALVEELARATSLAHAAWEVARERGDAASYLPHLERVVRATREQADCVRGASSRYDACLDEWEPGLDERSLFRLLDPLRAALLDLADRVSGADQPPELMLRTVAKTSQRALVRALLARFGFDFARGRMDEAAHPSTIRIGPGDVRLTARFEARRPTAGLFPALHELGHGLYDQNLPAEQFGMPAGDVSSLGLHESQARLFENLVGRSRAFWRFFLPALQAAAPTFRDLDVEQVHRSINRVVRTPDRVSADQVTYDLHIAMRIDLERALMTGDLQVADLPAAWDESSARLLVRPRDARTGLLQDGHWAAGMFGYFPTYTLGNLIAAQLYRAASAAIPDLEEHIASGSPAPLVEWLAGAVYRHGGLLPARVIVERATGKPIGVDAQCAHLGALLAEVYGIGSG
jgi:carboxypeptidase Taq